MAYYRMNLGLAKGFLCNGFNGSVQRRALKSSLSKLSSYRTLCTGLSNSKETLEVGNITPSSLENKSANVYKPSSNIEFIFDTHGLVLKLQQNGFTLLQAETLVSSLTEINRTSVSSATKYMVTKTEQSQLELKLNAIAEGIRKDMIILEKSELGLLKGENDKMKAEVLQLRKNLNDELLKLKSNVTLDMTLEKGRANEEVSSLKQLIKDTNNRIETEVAKLRTDMEAQKLDLIKYLVGSVLSILTVSIGVWRFLKA